MKTTGNNPIPQKPVPSTTEQVAGHFEQHGKDRFVIPQKNKKWGMKMDGEDGAFQYNTKKEAIEKAEAEARKAHSSVTVQNENGEVEQRKSFEDQNHG